VIWELQAFQGKPSKQVRCAQSKGSQVVVDGDGTLEKVVLTRLVRMNAMVSGIVTGIVTGLAIFVATNWLLIKGGPIGPDGEPIIGPHLELLGQYFIGYKVTFGGSCIGLAYGAVVGFGVGCFVAYVYNWLVRLRESRSRPHA
jgi:hypothetical protein